MATGKYITATQLSLLKDSVNDYLCELEEMLGIEFGFRIKAFVRKNRTPYSKVAQSAQLVKRYDDKTPDKVLRVGDVRTCFTYLINYQQGLADVYQALRIKEDPSIKKAGEIK